MSNTNLVNLFNSFNYKKIMRVKEMDDSQEYIINGAYRTHTKYGERIVLKLDDAILYLPSRFLSLGDEEVKELGCGGYSITKLPLRDECENSAYKLELKQINQSKYFYPPYIT